MNQQEIKIEVRKRKDNGYDLHDSMLRVEIYLENLTEDFDKLTGDNGRCAKHSRDISFVKRFVYMTMGGGTVLILILKFGSAIF